MFGTRLPRYRTRTGMFDDMVAAQVRRLGDAWPELVRPLQFAVEDVPPSDPVPWQVEPNMTSQCFPAGHGIVLRPPGNLLNRHRAVPHAVTDASTNQNRIAIGNS